jgi:hypothetical protein
LANERNVDVVSVGGEERHDVGLVLFAIRNHETSSTVQIISAANGLYFIGMARQKLPKGPSECLLLLGGILSKECRSRRIPQQQRASFQHASDYLESILARQSAESLRFLRNDIRVAGELDW